MRLWRPRTIFCPCKDFCASVSNEVNLVPRAFPLKNGKSPGDEVGNEVSFWSQSRVISFGHKYFPVLLSLYKVGAMK